MLFLPILYKRALATVVNSVGADWRPKGRAPLTRTPPTMSAWGTACPQMNGDGPIGLQIFASIVSWPNTLHIEHNARLLPVAVVLNWYKNPLSTIITANLWSGRLVSSASHASAMRDIETIPITAGIFSWWNSLWELSSRRSSTHVLPSLFLCHWPTTAGILCTVEETRGQDLSAKLLVVYAPAVSPCMRANLQSTRYKHLEYIECTALSHDNISHSSCPVFVHPEQ